MNRSFLSNECANAYPTDRQAAIDKCGRCVVGIMALCVDEVLDGLNSHGGASNNRLARQVRGGGVRQRVSVLKPIATPETTVVGSCIPPNAINFDGDSLLAS